MRIDDRPGRLGTLPPVPGWSFFFSAFPVLPALLLLAFAVLTWQEAVRGPLLALDPPLRSAIAGASVTPPARAAGWYFLADLGSAQVAVPVLAVAVVFAAWRDRRWLPPLTGAAVMVAVPVLVVPLKAAIGRSGPGSLRIAADYPGLYPSGHTATAAAAYGAAMLLLVPFVRQTAARRALVVVTVLVNLMVGVALVYCGYHWPLDVLGSWLMCGALLSVAARAVGVSCWSGSRG